MGELFLAVAPDGLRVEDITGKARSRDLLMLSLGSSSAAALIAIAGTPSAESPRELAPGVWEFRGCLEAIAASSEAELRSKSNDGPGITAALRLRAGANPAWFRPENCDARCLLIELTGNP